MLTPPAPMTDIDDLLRATSPQIDGGEFDATFSRDGLALHLSSDQGGRFQVWTARRPTQDAPFSSVTLESPDINPASGSTFGFQPLDDLAIAFISAPYPGSLGGRDFWRGTFMNASWTWVATALSTAMNDDDARMTSDGLGVYLIRPTAGPREIAFATRSTLAADFTGEAAVASLDGPGGPSDDTAPVPIPDGLLFASSRPGGLGIDDLWFASGKPSTGAFAAPIPLTAINSPAKDGEPAWLVRTDGRCELVFTSSRTAPFLLHRSFVVAH